MLLIFVELLQFVCLFFFKTLTPSSKRRTSEVLTTAELEKLVTQQEIIVQQTPAGKKNMFAIKLITFS